MHRIDSHDATPDNKFTEGNPTIPVAATTVTAAWLNDAQENICQTIEGAGITLQKDAPGQLLTAVRNLGGEALWNNNQNYRNFALKFGLDGKLYLWLAPSGPNVDGVGVKSPGATGSEGFWLDFVASITPPAPPPPEKVEKYDLCEFYGFRHPTLKPGFQPGHGGLLYNVPALYPKAWAYLQTVEGQKLCTTEAQWQAMVNAVWHTNADGSRVGWNGIGGAPFYVLNTGNGTLRMPDLRGMYAEAAGFDALGVGGVHGDAGRRMVATIDPVQGTGVGGSGAIAYAGGSSEFMVGNGSRNARFGLFSFDSYRVMPVAAKFQPRAWGSLACVCLDPAAS